jgi:hypothetical protein
LVSKDLHIFVFPDSEKDRLKGLATNDHQRANPNCFRRSKVLIIVPMTEDPKAGPINEKYEKSRPFSIEQFNNMILGIEMIYAVGLRLSNAVAAQKCDYLTQEATMAFAKTMMSVVAFLRFIPSSKYHAKAMHELMDLSSASVMARQAMEDAVSFLYLSKSGLSDQQKEFRKVVWIYCGASEELESAKLIAVSKTDQSPVAAERDRCKKRLEGEEFEAQFAPMKRDRRGRIRKGELNQALHDHEILERRKINTDTYDFYRKVLSNFAHFSTYSHKMIMGTSADWSQSWRRFQPPTLAVANFAAEVVAGFIEIFPHVRQLMSNDEQTIVNNFRASPFVETLDLRA